MTTVLITGASGFIGRHLASTLHAAGVDVVGTSRRAQDLPAYGQIYGVALGESLAPVLESEAVDAIVHCALAGGPDEYAVNVAGTRRWLEEGRGRGVGLQIFLSSLSATAEARSGYGRAKFELEQAFVAADQVVFRLGVVVGDGGMFARIREASRKAPVVPLLDNGAQLIYVLGIDYLCAVLRDCILGDGEGLRGRPWNLHQPRPYTLRQVTEAINRHYRYRRLLLPIPSRPILLALQVLERLPHIHVPISSANVQGLRQQGRQHIPSDFDRFGYPEESLERLVARVQD